MNAMYSDIVSLIYSAITENEIVLSDNFDWKTAIEMARFHKIEVLVYYGAFYSKITIPTEYENILKKCVFAQSSLDAQQDYEISKFCEALDKQGIAYLPLKGMLIKKYYPKSEMRYMSDADILIKEDEYSKIENTMIELGYSFKVESDHEYIWNKQTVCIELHKRLIPSYNKDYYEYYGDGWRLAKMDNGEYKMSDEDFYIYLFTHLAKHYRDRGIGIKQFVDLWVYSRQKLSLNFSYIQRELEKLQLAKFHKNCIDMLKMWFEGADETEITQHMTNFVFFSGVYGDEKIGEISAALKETLEMDNTNNLRNKFYLKNIFLPYKFMKMRYKVLERVPVLLPIMWAVRIFDVIVFNRDKIKMNIERLNQLTNSNIDAYKNFLNYVGLEFDFKGKE